MNIDYYEVMTSHLSPNSYHHCMTLNHMNEKIGFLEKEEFKFEGNSSAPGCIMGTNLYCYNVVIENVDQLMFYIALHKKRSV